MKAAPQYWIVVMDGRIRFLGEEKLTAEEAKIKGAGRTGKDVTAFPLGSRKSAFGSQSKRSQLDRAAIAKHHANKRKAL